MHDLSGKVAVVTGAASGLGRGVAERLAQEGMKVVLADIEQPALDQAVAELRHAEHDVMGVQVDVMSRDGVRELAEKTLEHYGAIHLLHNNAGVLGYVEGPIWEATQNDWAWTMGVNFWGVVNGAEVFLPIMLKSGEECHIITTASAAGFIQPRSSPMYVVTKHAVVAYTEALYTELLDKGSNVHVSVVCPGGMRTNLGTSFRNRPETLKNPSNSEHDRIREDVRARMVERQKGYVLPSVSADIVVDGVKEDLFYIFTDHEWDDLARIRFEGVLARRNPPAAQA